ncbi:hypothetical protein GCM10009430_17530 [Aquimarina litoralis]|uniref:Secretion system C-terminal sorting domain-containing protein n=2 Tax=Aquimarina litoralis TaxID=584605 RepID=A0ABP3TVM9_9FLAO
MYMASSQTTKQGGFLYGWDQYTSDTYTGLGSRNVNWNSDGMNSIVHAPEIGIHPRVYFGPSEIPEIKNRLENTQSGQAITSVLRAYSILLHLGYQGYNQNAVYAKDAFGNRYIDNAGAWSASPYFQKLKDKDPTVWQGVDTKRKHRVAALMSIEAFLCLIFQNESTDPVIAKTYQERANELADAMHFWATLALEDDSVNPNGQNFNNFGGTHMALCYDLNYEALSETEREDMRMALNKIIPDTPRHGKNLACFANTSNWSTLNSFEIIINLAIEGENGYKPNLTKDWMRSLHNFINYGWYPSGAGYEGLGKNYQFVTTLIAAAKRGYSLLPHPHVRAYGENYLTAIMQPFGEGFTSYDVWGGSGAHPVLGKYKFNSSDAVGLKYAFPENDKIDFVWRNYIDGWSNNDSRGYVYAQIPPDDSYNNYLIPAAVFAMDYATDSWQSQANQVITEDYLALDRGLAVFKSSSDKGALSVQFHARQDMGGHTHGDRLDFTLSGLGRIWIRKTYGGSQFQPSKYHSMVLVNDQGVPVTDRDGDKSRQPATILDYNFSSEISTITADATHAYSWEWHWNDRLASQDHQWLDTDGWKKVTETFNDFLKVPKTEPHFNIPIYDYEHWHKPENLERIVKKEVNPMQKVVRTIGLLREKHPLLLVVDDVQKDENEQNYKWTAQIARGLELERYEVNLDNEDYKNDIILKEPSADGNRRLLVRVLENTNYDGTTNPGYIEVLDYVDIFTGIPFTPNPNWERKRLVVESNSVSPDFKVLLFPFREGDQLPITNWNTDKSLLTITFSDEVRNIKFYKNDEGNTAIELVDDTLGVEENDVAVNLVVYPNPSSKILRIDTSETIYGIEVYSSIGSLLKTIHKKDSADFKEIDLSGMVSGIYFFKVYLDNKKSVLKKIVIE